MSMVKKYRVVITNTYEVETNQGPQQAVGMALSNPQDTLRVGIDSKVSVMKDHTADTLSAVQQMVTALAPLLCGNDTPEPDA